MSFLWLATRATGEIAMILLAVTTVLGILQGVRTRSSRTHRLLRSELHRKISLVAVTFLVVHIATTVLDSYVTVPWWSAIVPLTSPYETSALAVGALAVDLLIVIVVTSLLRSHIGHRAWRIVHYGAYAAWALGTAHALLAGTDLGLTFIIAGVTTGAVIAALLLRLLIPDTPHSRGTGTGDDTPPSQPVPLPAPRHLANLRTTTPPRRPS